MLIDIYNTICEELREFWERFKINYFEPPDGYDLADMYS